MATIDKYLKVRKGVDTPDVLTSSATVHDYFKTPVVIFETASTTNINYLNPAHMFWNYEEGTVDIIMNDGVSQSVGMQTYMPPTKNNSGDTIPAGSVVMATGAQGDRITIAKAITNGTVGPEYVIGLAAQEIINGSEDGLIVVNGTIRDINTASWTEGTILYPDPNNSGGLTSTKPSSPAVKTPIAIVLRQQENSGRIYARTTNGSVLGGTDANVEFTNVSDNDVILYNGSASYWYNESLSTAVQNIDGPDSGIDADLLDGQEGSYYAPIDSPTFTGTVNAPEPTTASNVATKNYVDNVISSGGVVVSSASAYPSSAAEHTLFFNTSAERMAVRVGSVWKELAFVSDAPIGGGDSSTLVFASSIDGGDSSTTNFVNNYDGGNS